MSTVGDAIEAHALTVNEKLFALIAMHEKNLSLAAINTQK